MIKCVSLIKATLSNNFLTEETVKKLFTGIP